jgi:hypothetical protein
VTQFTVFDRKQNVNMLNELNDYSMQACMCMCDMQSERCFGWSAANQPNQSKKWNEKTRKSQAEMSENE